MGSEQGQVSRDDLIEKNLPLVGYQVAELLRRVPSFVQREDLASAGALALVQAAKSFDPEQGVPFHRFAIYRIRGAMLDELRSMDWATRGARQRTKQLEEMTQTLTAARGRAPTREELAFALGVEVDQVESAQQDAARRVVSIDSPMGEDDNRTLELVDDKLSPEDRVLDDERMVYLRASVQALPQRLRFVVEQIFFEEKPIQDIADALGVTQSRVSQLRSEALAMMRDGMNRHLDPEAEAEEAQETSGIIKKRRESYFQKIEDNATAMREAAQPQADTQPDASAAAPPPDAGPPVSPPSRQAVFEKTKEGAKSKSALKLPSVKRGAKSSPDSSSHSTSSSSNFLAGRTKSSAEAKAKLKAQEEARRLAEEEKRKSQDKPPSPKSSPPEEEPPSEEKPRTPPTTSYLGGLSLKRASDSAQARRGPRKK